MTHLLATNDFPPKVGGIQSYLYELWRRLPNDFTVLTGTWGANDTFDDEQSFPIVRAGKVLLPTPVMRRKIDEVADDAGATFVVIDPAVPLGISGPSLAHPYAVVLHGAEVTVPGRLPGSKQALARVVRNARLVISAGSYPANEARRLVGDAMPPVLNIPPGVDVDRFVPLTDSQRKEARAKFGVSDDDELVVSVSRLVPRKGMDTLIRAAALLSPSRPRLKVLIAGKGRDRDRLQRLAHRLDAPVRFLGRVDHDDLPAIFGCGDVFAMLCRNRWGGLEQEGFGIVFLEAAAAGVPQVAGRSGGADEAVIDGETGLVVEDPSNPDAVATALARLLDDDGLRQRAAKAGRDRVESEFSYDILAARLAESLTAFESTP